MSKRVDTVMKTLRPKLEHAEREAQRLADQDDHHYVVGVHPTYGGIWASDVALGRQGFTDKFTIFFTVKPSKAKSKTT